MLRFIYAALLLLAAPPAFGQEPRKDPFLAPDNEIRAMIPRTIKQISVQLDWIRLPHLTANQLIRQHLKHTEDGGALHKAVQELIGQKKAERLDFMTVPVRNGQRSKNESIVEFPYPTEFDPALINKRILLDGDYAWDQVVPVTASTFATKNTGRTCEVEAAVRNDSATIDLNLAPAWIEHLADLSWGRTPNNVLQPVFGDNLCTSSLLLKNGAWQMAGLFTPPHGAPAEKLHGTVDVLPAERVMLFVRAAMETPVKPGPEAEWPRVRQITVLAEWIELDTTLMAELLAKHPAVGDAVIRDELEPMLLDGRASLLESSAVQVRGGQRSKIESVTEYPYPTEFDPPQGGHTFDGPPLPPSKPVSYPRITPPVYQTFATKNLGTTMEVEAAVLNDDLTIDLSLAPELIFNLGTVTYGKGISARAEAKFHSMRTTAQVLTFPNVPSIIGSFDAPLRPGQESPAVQKRKVLLFVRGIL